MPQTTGNAAYEKLSPESQAKLKEFMGSGLNYSKASEALNKRKYFLAKLKSRNPALAEGLPEQPRGVAALSREQRSAAAIKGKETLGPEGRRAAVKKGHETRRRNEAAAAAQAEAGNTQPPDLTHAVVQSVFEFNDRSIQLMEDLRNQRRAGESEVDSLRRVIGYGRNSVDPHQKNDYEMLWLALYQLTRPRGG